MREVLFKTLRQWCSSLYIVLFLFLIVPLVGNAAEVKIQATPDEGLQPRLVVDQLGNTHLLYFKKRLRSREAREGNLYYRQYLAEQNRFSAPVKVSSQAFNLQTFSIARASMAIGGDGRIHVIWVQPGDGAAYAYTRSDPQRSKFEPQQSIVSQYLEGIDAGADVAAFGNRVAVVWGAGDLSREDERTVFARMSDDYGASFGEEMSIGNPDLGACACCSLATDYLDDDALLVAYRSAIDGIGRDMQSLELQLTGKDITAASYGPVRPLQEWELSACPLSTNDIAIDAAASRWLVFETESRIVRLNLQSEQEPALIADPYTETRQKNPAIAFNADQESIVVWGEAISHARGGRLNYRLFDSEGEVQTVSPAEPITIPNYSFPAAAALPNGDFLVLY